jgi:hypothetical protein
MMKKLLMAGAGLFALTGASHAVVLFEDNFNANPIGNNTVPAGWTVPVGSVDVVSLYPGESRQIDLDGSTNNGGALQSVQTFDLMAGRSYTLSFDYGKNGAGAEAMSFNIGSKGSGVLNLFGAMPIMDSITFTFVALSTELGVTLNFASYFTADNQGLVLDNVRFEELTPVPVPPALLLLGTGIFGMGALARRNKA